MIGVVLAGGKSTRLPNKLSLPQRGMQYRPIILSSIEYALSFCNRVYILLSIEEYNNFTNLLYVDFNRVEIIIDEHIGIPKAIAQIAALHSDELLFIVCGDNIYEKIYPPITNKEMVFTKNVTKEQAQNLSLKDLLYNFYYQHGTENHKILLRITSKLISNYNALITPWILKAERFIETNLENKTIEELLSEWQIKEYHLEDKIKWYDIGTFQSYEQYIIETS